MQIVEEIIYNFENNKSLYIGENITIADHMIQSAMLAEKAKCDDDLICSCLQMIMDKIDDPDKLKIKWMIFLTKIKINSFKSDKLVT